MTNVDKLRDTNPWHPIKDPIDLKILGKFAEELNECGSAVARCIIQGVNEVEPVTGKLNKEWLENEIADVIAGINLTIARFHLDHDRMTNRTARKMKHLKQWHSLA